MNGNVDITYLKIKRAIEKNTECFFCDLEAELEFRYLTNYLQELVMDSKARDKIVESRGFCNTHSYKLLAQANKPTISDQHGVALVMQSITNQIIQDITLQNDARKNTLKIMIGKRCPACAHNEDYMKMYLHDFAEHLGSSEEFRCLFKASKGVCIPHFTTIICMTERKKTSQSQRILEILLEVEGKNFERLNDELAEYIKRQSYEFPEKDRIALADVVPRSVEKIVGRREIKFPQQT